MQPTVKSALLCDYAMTGEDGKLSIIGIFGNVNFPSLPNSYPRFFVVIILSLDRGVFPVQLGITDPTGQQILQDPPTVEIQVDTSGADTNLVIDFNNLVFNQAGIYQIQLYLNGQIIHSIPLTVQSMASSGLPPIRAN